MPSTSASVSTVRPRCLIAQTPTMTESTPSSASMVRVPPLSSVRARPSTKRMIPATTSWMPNSSARTTTVLPGQIIASTPTTTVTAPKMPTRIAEPRLTDSSRACAVSIMLPWLDIDCSLPAGAYRPTPLLLLQLHRGPQGLGACVFLLARDACVVRLVAGRPRPAVRRSGLERLEQQVHQAFPGRHAVLPLGAVLVRLDDQHPVVQPRAEVLLELAPLVRVQGAGVRHVEAQLDLGRGGVHPLPTGPGRAREVLLQVLLAQPQTLRQPRRGVDEQVLSGESGPGAHAASLRRS